MAEPLSHQQLAFSAYLPVAMPRIAPTDISVVIQGPLHRRGVRGRSITECLASLQTHLPGAEIIIATWHGESVEDLTANTILQLDDPGHVMDINGTRINLQRQVASTLAGVKAATRPYVLKIRADIALTGAEFAVATHFGDAVPAAMRYFSAPITTLNYFARDPARAPLLFNVSDIIQFGHRANILDFWEGPAFTAETLLNSQAHSINPIGHWHGFTRQFLFPEQALMVRWLQRHGATITPSRPDAITRATAQLSEQYVCSHFHIVPVPEASVLLPSHIIGSAPSITTLYRTNELPRIAAQAFGNYGPRYAQIQRNRYFGAFISYYWCVVTITMLLQRVVPNLAPKIRALYRRYMGYQRE